MFDEITKSMTEPCVKPSADILVPDYLLRLKAKWPHLYDCIDLDRLSDTNFTFITDLASQINDFDSIRNGGRGEFYRRAQHNPLIRAVGIRRLFELASKDHNLNNLTPDYKILDVLGGDGVLARAIERLSQPSSTPSVITSDLTEGMVYAAQSYGLFAIRQAAQKLLLKDNSIDGLIMAYGTHHIPLEDRLQVCHESFRVLKPGGKMVLHDFETDSPMSNWFNNVVDPYSLTGHRVSHFTRQEIKDLLDGAGFTNVEVAYTYDPFILFAKTERQANRQLANCLLDMYGLVKLIDEHGKEGAAKTVHTLACKWFKYDYRSMGLPESFGASEITATPIEGRWKIEAPRVALVGSASKPTR